MIKKYVMKQFVDRYICDKCYVGEVITMHTEDWDGKSNTLHECNKCGHKHKLDKDYPNFYRTETLIHKD